jgi:hypothetical protein
LWAQPDSVNAVITSLATCLMSAPPKEDNADQVSLGQPLQHPRNLRRVPMTAPSGRRDTARVERRSNAVQARYPGRPQLGDDRR